MYLRRGKLEDDAFPWWRQFVYCYCNCKVAVLGLSYEAGYTWLSKALEHWLLIYEGANSAWLIPVMKTLALNLVDLAILADRQADVTDPHFSSHKHCVEARGSLENAFAVSCRCGKRNCVLAVTNALYKLYFKLDEVQMAVVFQSRVNSQLTLSFNEFPRSDRVGWKYYNGLMAMERLKFREAEECLTYALEQSHPSTPNLQKILFLLAMLRLLFNEFPTETLLRAYGMTKLRVLVQAVKEARLDAFEKFLEQESLYLASMRIWPLAQKLINVIYRNILFKCHRLHVRCAERPAHQMDVEILVAGLRASGMVEADVTDALSVARTVIRKNMMSGYIAVQRKLLVLHKQVPFPKLRDINLEAGEMFVELE